MGINIGTTGVDEIYVGEGNLVNDYSAMRGPCPEGFHVPSRDEWVTLCGILTNKFNMTTGAVTMGSYLKLPMAGRRLNTSSVVGDVNSQGFYWSSTAYQTYRAYYVSFKSSTLNPAGYNYRSLGASIRPFKDTPVIPNSSWTTLYDGSSTATGAGVFYDSTDGLISASGDGVIRYTISDKNLGATTIYNDGDTLTENNCGKYYQRGNNYGFPFTGTITTSSTQVDASNYGPSNYYSSSTFIKRNGVSNYDWSLVQNDNLRGGVTGVQQKQAGNVTEVYVGTTKVRPYLPLKSYAQLIAMTGVDAGVELNKYPSDYFYKLNNEGYIYTPYSPDNTFSYNYKNNPGDGESYMKYYWYYNNGVWSAYKIYSA